MSCREKITLRQITDQLGTRAYGAFIVLLTIPNFIPGISFIALEALIGDGANGKNTEEKLSDRYSYLMGGTRQYREKLKLDFKEAYQIRSRLVHGSASRLISGQRRHLPSIKLYFDKLLRKEIEAYKVESEMKKRKASSSSSLSGSAKQKL